jgi:hypothetical protein
MAPQNWILPRRPDRLLAQRDLPNRLDRQDQLVPQVLRPREHPAAQRDLGHPYHLSDRLVRLVLQISRRAPSRLRAQLLSRYAYASPSHYSLT